MTRFESPRKQGAERAGRGSRPWPPSSSERGVKRPLRPVSRAANASRFSSERRPQNTSNRLRSPAVLMSVASVVSAVFFDNLALLDSRPTDSTGLQTPNRHGEHSRRQGFPTSHKCASRSMRW